MSLLYCLSGDWTGGSQCRIDDCANRGSVSVIPSKALRPEQHLISPSTQTWRSNFTSFMPKSLFMLSAFLTQPLPPPPCIQLYPSVLQRSCLLFHRNSPLRQTSLRFSHAGFQVLGHYIRRQQDPETFISEIKYIASDPDDKYFFNVTDEAALNDIVDALGDRIFTLEGL